MRPPYTGHCVGKPPSVAMKEGYAVQVTVGVVQAELYNGIHRVHIQIAMSHHHAFGPARSSRSIQKGGSLIFVDVDGRRRFGLRIGKQLLVAGPGTCWRLRLVGGDDELLNCCQVLHMGSTRCSRPCSTINTLAPPWFKMYSKSSAT